MYIWSFEPELGLLAICHFYNYVGAENQLAITSALETIPAKQRSSITRIYTDKRQVVPSDLHDSDYDQVGDFYNRFARWAIVNTENLPERTSSIKHAILLQEESTASPALEKRIGSFKETQHVVVCTFRDENDANLFLGLDASFSINNCFVDEQIRTTDE